MASILKEKKNLTIKAQFHQYLGQIAGMIVILMVLCLGFGMQVMVQMHQENRNLYLLNDFYEELKEMQNCLGQYAMEQDEQTYEQLQKKLDSLRGELVQLKSFRVSTVFLRDVQDLESMLAQYAGKAKDLSRMPRETTEIASVNRVYYQAQQIYEMMSGMFHSLYSQILASGELASNRTQRLFLCFMAVFLATVALIVRYLMLQIQNMERRITEPIQELAGKVQALDLHSLQEETMMSESSGMSRELQVLAEGYNSMLVKIRNQLKELENYHSTRIQLQKSQMMNLQMQINPHFLFNTLTMISHTAYLEDDMEIVNLLDITSSLLRYALDYYDRSVSLKKEIEEAGNYVYLQEKRFGSRIRFEFDLDERFHEVQIPNMILQPLLENAIVHGVGMYTEGGLIRITTRYQEEERTGMIEVWDNGEGADEAEVLRVREKISSEQIPTGKVGLANVAFRLNIFFGGRSRMFFFSSPGEGTSVKIEIPCGENKNTESDTGGDTEYAEADGCR